MTPVMIIPILVLQSLNLHKSEILAIAFLLCMGCLTIVATLLRYIYVTKRNAQGKGGNPNLITSVRPFCMTWRPPDDLRGGGSADEKLYNTAKHKSGLTLKAASRFSQRVFLLAVCSLPGSGSAARP